jgi:Sec-independent protein secretion pathway component TatC
LRVSGELKIMPDRAELPGMSLMEHLEELRKRLVHTILYLLGGMHHRRHLFSR